MDYIVLEFITLFCTGLFAGIEFMPLGLMFFPRRVSSRDEGDRWHCRAWSVSTRCFRLGTPVVILIRYAEKPRQCEPSGG